MQVSETNSAATAQAQVQGPDLKQSLKNKTVQKPAFSLATDDADEPNETSQLLALPSRQPQKISDIKNNDSSDSIDGSHLRTFSKKSTAFNTDAAPSEQLSDAQDEDVAMMAPLEGFEWRGLNFPEVDMLDLRVQQNGNEIKLKSYRWPASGERKAVVFMMHGYGSCCPHMAVAAKYLAQAGYEVFGMDMRGMGDSEGVRGQLDNTEVIYSDYWLLIFEACKKFKVNQQRTPIFLFGRSFGGLIATNMANSTIGRAMFAGVCLLTPYYRLFTERLYESYKWLVPLCKVRPNHVFPCEY